MRICIILWSLQEMWSWFMRLPWKRDSPSLCIQVCSTASTEGWNLGLTHAFSLGKYIEKDALPPSDERHRMTWEQCWGCLSRNLSWTPFRKKKISNASVEEELTTHRPEAAIPGQSQNRQWSSASPGKNIRQNKSQRTCFHPRGLLWDEGQHR